MSLLPIGRRKPSSRGRGRATAASGTLLLALLASLGGQTGTAAAVPAAPITTTAAPATAPPKAAGPQATPTPDPTADHEAAVRTLQNSDLSAPCPAAVAPNTVVTCAVDPSKTASFSLALQQKDLVLLQVITTRSSTTKLIAPGGATVTCDFAHGSTRTRRCPTSQAGTYTLQVTDKSAMANGISVSYAPLLSSTACKAIGAGDRRLGGPTVFPGALSTGSAGDCYTLDLAAGDVLRAYSSSSDVLHSVFDASGQEICTSYLRGAYAMDCRLTGNAPFRISALQARGDAVAYNYSVARLSKPEGCALVVPQAFGAAPDLSPTEHCRILRVTQAAEHSFAEVSSGIAPLPSRLVSVAGDVIPGCDDGTCDLAPGDYTWSADPGPGISRPSVSHSSPPRRTGDARRPTTTASWPVRSPERSARPGSSSA